MNREVKEAKVYVEVDIKAVAKCPSFSRLAQVYWVTKKKTEKIRAEGILADPSITLCLVAEYLNKPIGPARKDRNKTVEVKFSRTIRCVPLSAIKRIIFRP